MRSLPTPSRNEVRQHLEIALEEFEHAGVEHGYPVTEGELDAILALYDEYDANAGAPSVQMQGAGLANELRNQLHEGYRFIREGMKLANLRITLARGIKYCPVCEISYPGELDHYLPRSIYKPFAIYVRNLVPHCHDCNKRKSAFVGGNPASRFIHVYLEALPANQFLTATVSLDDNALDVEFSIGPAVGLAPLLQERLARQFERLKLNDRYRRELNPYIIGHTVGLHDAYGAGNGQAVQSYLLRQASVEKQIFHANHWRPVLLGALAGHADFCDGGFANVLPEITQAEPDFAESAY